MKMRKIKKVIRMTMNPRRTNESENEDNNEDEN